jgi:peptide-methionine (S)-S-oxide reductase
MNLGRIARVATVAALTAASAFGLWAATTANAVEQAVSIPAPGIDLPQSGTEAKAIFAGGCFWGVQGVFQHVKGVKNAVSGYAGGEAGTAFYEAVGSGQTGHAEAVEVTYDPSVVTYGQLMQILFSVAMNPTQLNYQGPDHGTQYRNAIFVQSDEEKAVAAAYIAQLDAAGVYPAKIVTTLEPFEAFYPAEQYHQDFLTLNPTYPYIAIHDIPKVVALQELFPQVWQEQPALVGML